MYKQTHVLSIPTKTNVEKTYYWESSLKLRKKSLKDEGRRMKDVDTVYIFDQ